MRVYDVIKTAEDTESRLRAFQVLKDIYKDNPKEFEY